MRKHRKARAWLSWRSARFDRGHGFVKITDWVASMRGKDRLAARTKLGVAS